MRFKSILSAAAILTCLSVQAVAKSGPLDLSDPAVRAQLDAYMQTWIDNNAGRIMEAVQKHIDAEEQKNSPQLAEFVSRADELIAGNAPHDGADLSTAKIVVVEFFDFNCPFCQAIHKEFNALKPANPDVAFIYRDYPILMDSSRAAAEAGRAAMAQGKYPQFADGVFTLPSHGVTEEGIAQHAEAAGLDMAQFAADRASPEAKAAVEKDFQQARSLKIQGTPFVFVWSTEHRKGAIVGGMAPAEQFQSVFDALRRGEDVAQ